VSHLVGAKRRPLDDVDKNRTTHADNNIVRKPTFYYSDEFDSALTFTLKTLEKQGNCYEEITIRAAEEKDASF
jgi:hypothetical protein